MRYSWCKLNGIKTYSFSAMDELVEYGMDQKKLLVAINSDKITYAEPRLKTIIDRNIGYCDGNGAVWAINQKGLNDAIKIAGCDLWLEFVKKYYRSKSFYLIGAEKCVVQKVVDKLESEYPEINIVGYRDGFIRIHSEEETLINDIAEKKPDIIFVAMGSPKQEYLMDDISKKHNAVMLGLGGSFNVYSGNVKRAPKIFLDLKLEFLYRYIFNGVKWSRIMSDFKFFRMLLMRRL